MKNPFDDLNRAMRALCGIKTLEAWIRRAVAPHYFKSKIKKSN